MPASDTGPRHHVADGAPRPPAPPVPSVPPVRPGPPGPPRLPAPPDDEELYWYFGPQRRWVLLCATLSYAGATATLGLFALSRPLLWPFLVLTVLNAATWLLSWPTASAPAGSPATRTTCCCAPGGRPAAPPSTCCCPPPVNRWTSWPTPTGTPPPSAGPAS
ncbi:hypothetical protein ACFQ0M_06755 [Kitasatospora aburaviensis]